MTLDELRVKIDEIDSEIKELFLERMSVAEQVAEIKSGTGDKVLKPEREEAVIKRLTADMGAEMKPAYTSFMKKVMEVSRIFQYRKMLELGARFDLDYREEEPHAGRICYQGLPGSYSELAASILFPDAVRLPVNSFGEVFQSISEGGAEAGVVPLENTTAGSVYEVYDLLISHNLYINASHIEKVNHCLAAVPGARLEDIREVYSHPQALAQSEKFLKRYGLIGRERSNTAVAAKEVAELKDRSIAAVCSREAASHYGLTVLREGINHNKENATKFVAVSKYLVVKDDHDKIAVVFSCPHRSGSLASVLGIFGDYGVNLTEIHSRPDGKKPWEYLFYVDFTGNLKDENIRALLYQLHEELPYIKVIGSYENKA